MLYISTKFCEIISISIKVIERTRFLYWKLQRGIILQKNVGGATVVNLCNSSGHALYLCQVSWNNIKRYQSYRVSTISIRKITKGNNSAKHAGGATVVNLCMLSVMLYISTKFCEIISNGIKVIGWTRFLYWKLQRGIIPKKNVGGVTVVNLCTSSGHALYFYQVLWHYLKQYQSYRADTISILKITKGNNSAKNAGWVNVSVISACHLVMFYICAMFHEIILNGFKDIERTQFLYGK